MFAANVKAKPAPFTDSMNSPSTADVSDKGISGYRINRPMPTPTMTPKIPIAMKLLVFDFCLRWLNFLAPCLAFAVGELSIYPRGDCIFKGPNFMLKFFIVVRLNWAVDTRVGDDNRLSCLALGSILV